MQKRKLMSLAFLLIATCAFLIAQTVLANTIYLPYTSLNRTATPTKTATPTATTTQAAIDVEIMEVNSPDTLSEYVRIKNNGTRPVDMQDWKLVITHPQLDPKPQFIFPDFTLHAGREVKVWTKTGTDTTTDLYADESEAQWPESGFMVLRDGESPSKVVSEFGY